MIKYLFRSVKYLVKLALLLAAIFFLMRWSNTSNLPTDSWEGFFASYFSTWRGWLFTVAIVVWCALYPHIEFIRRSVGGNLWEDKLPIIKALNAGGMILAEETETRMVFRAESPVRKLWWMGDDAVTITRTEAGSLEIEGPRRFVMEAAQRIPTYIKSSNGE